jgi:NADH dehydrogenase [ubiquinone] 1 alpha subcomplex assembly factor 7
VETSPVLRARQQAMLAGAGTTIRWTGQLEAALEGPVLLIANELLDALPVRQFVATERGWCERLVGLNDAGKLTFGLAAEPTRPCGPGHFPGLVVELPTLSDQIVGLIASHLATAGGAALLIDYGSSEDGTGDTLQAVRRHQFADPLSEPGEADLTTQVNFARVGDIAARAGARVHGPVPQAHLMAALGLGARAANLKRRASPEQAAALDAAVLRLTSMEERGMGALFKAIGLSHPSLVALPGLTGPQT